MRYITEEGVIGQTIKTLMPLTAAYYNDLLCLVNNHHARNRLHEATGPCDYRYYACDQPLSYVSSSGTNIFGMGGKGRYKYLELTNAGSAIGTDIYPSLGRGYVGLREERIDRTLLSSRCAIMSSMIGAEIGKMNSLSDVRKKGLPRFYPPGVIKDASYYNADDTKYMFSQIRGVLETRTMIPIPMYGTKGKEGLVFKGEAEQKIHAIIRNMFPQSAFMADVCVIVGDNWESAWDTLRVRRKWKREELMTESEKEASKSMKVTQLYRNVHFFPVSQDGINSFRLFNSDMTGSALSRLLVPDAGLYSGTDTFIEYDARMGDTVYYQFMTGNISRMKRLADYLSTEPEKIRAIVYCMQSQQRFLGTLFKDVMEYVEVQTVTDIDLLMQDMNKEYGLDLKYYRFKY